MKNLSEFLTESSISRRELEDIEDTVELYLRTSEDIQDLSSVISAITKGVREAYKNRTTSQNKDDKFNKITTSLKKFLDEIEKIRI